MATIVDDIRSSVRLVRRSPGTVALAVLSLTLGIGANTAVFSFVNAIQFRALPVADEATLVDLSETSTTELCAGCSVGTSYPTYLEWKQAATSFGAIEGYREERFVVSGGTGPERIGGALTSAGLFDVLGVQPAIGRDVSAADDAPSAAPVVVISEVANLLLVRASERRREVAIRIALGATRIRIVRLLVAEGLTLAVTGGILGWLLALWASNAIVAVFGTEVPYWIQFGIDWRVLVFAVAVTVVTGALCGLAPAIQASRASPQTALKDGGAVVSGGSGSRVRAVLASAQLALALVLLAGAGLLMKTVTRTFTVTLSYDPSRVLVGDLELADRRYEDVGRIRGFADAILERLDRIDGVRSGLSRQVFFAGFGGERRRMEVEGSRGIPDGASPSF